MLSPPMPLVGATESISSKNTTHGAACLALLNISLIPRSDSPTHLDNNSGPLTLMKLASDSVATAFASSVFPVPDGPCISRPFGIACPNFVYKSGYLKGHSTASCSSRFTSSNPPIVVQGISGDSKYTSLIAEGITSFTAFSKSLIVTTSLFNTSGDSFSSSKLSSGSNLLRHFIAASLQIFKISTYETMSYCSDFILIYISIQWHITCMYLQYLQSASLIRNLNLYFSVKSTRAS